MNDHIADPATKAFIAHRNLLFTIAYEMLGSAADAEDILQETWLRWVEVDLMQVREQRAYLVRITTRLALNRLRTVKRRRSAASATLSPRDRSAAGRREKSPKPSPTSPPQTPQTMAPELAGPQTESLIDMARRLIAAGGARRRPVLPVYYPGGMSSGGLIPTGPGPRGSQTFADWLRERITATPA
ncbi:ECF RNA polymerase sigma factor SigJ [Streptomyces sp. MBT84]|nr:ECF RNA polymerase sigma factor SigJ [Streptomyces sp. MBT84]